MVNYPYPILQVDNVGSHMESFSEIFKAFDDALKDVAIKKKSFDEATHTLQTAEASYNASVEAATEVRTRLGSLLNGVLPNEETARVRVR